MKKVLLFLALLFSIAQVSAKDNGRNSVTASRHISADRFFYVTYRFIDAAGVGRVGHFVWSCRYAYPLQSDLLFRAADLTCRDHHCIQITGIDAICQSDYNALSKSK